MNSHALLNSITISLIQTPVWIALLILIFSEPLSAYLGQASIYFVIGAMISMTIIGYFSTWKGIIWIPQSVPVTILATITTAIIADSGQALNDVSADALFVTILMVIALSSLLTGIILYVLGMLKLGHLIQQLPFPVTAGFLGGAGYLLLESSMMTAVGAHPNTQGSLFDQRMYWLPVLLLGLLLYGLEQRIKHALLLPMVVMIAIIGFHGMVFMSDIPLSTWRLTGWFFEPLPVGTSFRFIEWAQWQQVQWQVIAAHSGSLLLLAITSAVGMLIFSNGFALSVNATIDINKDLKTTGFANVVSGLFAGWPGYVSLALSSINAKQGQRLPLTGVLATLFSGFLLYFSTHFLVFVPRLVICAVLAYIGFSFVFTWVVIPLTRSTWSERSILLSVLLMVVFFGLFEAMLAGLMISFALFLWQSCSGMKRQVSN